MFYKYLMRTYNLWQGFQIIKMYDLDRDFQTVSIKKNQSKLFRHDHASFKI